MIDYLSQKLMSPLNAPWSIRFERDGTEDVAVICDADGVELVRSRHFWLAAPDDQEPATLASMRLIQAAPALLEGLRLAQDALNTAPRFRVGETDSYKIAAKVHGVLALATNPLPVTRSPLELTEDEFDARFPLLTNHLNPNASWGSGNEGGCLFETYGEELEFVQRQDPHMVWTLVDGDGNDQYLVSGFLFVNRIGYLVSSISLREGLDIEVRIPSGDADETETNAAGEE
jgi:hypothetical protein